MWCQRLEAVVLVFVYLLALFFLLRGAYRQDILPQIFLSLETHLVS